MAVTDSFKRAFDDVKARLREAGRTRHRLRESGWTVPQEMRARWPAFLSDYPDPDKRTVAPVSAQAIDRMDEAFGWVLWLEDGVRQIVLARACGTTWRKLEDKDGRSRETLRKLHDEALAIIVARLFETGTHALPERHAGE